MAHLIKSTRGATGGLTRHFERYKNKNGEYIQFGNQEINTSKCYLNYNLAEDKNQMEFIKRRTSEVRCLNRKNVNVMCSWVITIPETLNTKEDQSLFFKESYQFLENLYGKENVISSFVHLDETTPHMHFAFIPVVYDKTKEEYKVSAKELINRKHLQEFHPKLENHMEKIFGRNIGILNEATKEGNKSIEELKRMTAQKDLEALKSSLDAFKQELDILDYSKDKIQNLDQIDAKKGVFNKDQVSIKEKDFNTLIYMAKNYLKDTEYLKGENFELKENLKRMNERFSEKETLKNLTSKVTLQSEINKLNFNLETYIDFIKKMNLTDDFKKHVKYLKKSKELEL